MSEYRHGGCAACDARCAEAAELTMQVRILELSMQVRILKAKNDANEMLKERLVQRIKDLEEENRIVTNQKEET